MATVIAKTYTIPVIAAVRTTCAGTQYIVDTPECTNVVTVHGSHTSCTCHESGCDSICIVNRRAKDAARDARRTAYEASFDLSYGDIVA